MNINRYSLSSVLRDAAGEGAGGAPAGGAPAGGAPAGGAPAGGAPAGGAPAGGAAEPFYKSWGLDEPSARFIEDRKYDSPQTILKSAMEADRVARARNVIEKPDPQKLNEWKGWSELGWTEDPAKYAEGFKKPEVKQGQVFNEELFGAAQKVAHELRLPAGMGSQFYGKMYDFMQGKAAEYAQSEAARAETERKALDTTLRTEWGNDYEKRAERSRRAVVALGVAKESSAELAKIIGAPALVKLFDGFAEKLGEDSLNPPGANADGLNTAPQLEAEIRRLQSDPAFLAVLSDERHPQHKDKVQARQRLIDRLAKMKAQA